MKSILLAVVLSLTAVTMTQASDGLAKDVVVYKNPQCGCCNKWVRYLEDHGYNVSVENTRDVYAVKQMLGVPERLASCHTAIIDGYVVEGHITHRDIEKLLLTRPEVKGIAVPGMPAGTPGMEIGNVVESYDVISFDENGNLKIFSRH
jgi:hypothetical protein